MRPHVELVANEDLMWHVAELPKSEGKVKQRNLSYDEENGAASTLIHFETAWSRPAGYHEADTEWYILKGQVKMGKELFGPHTYFRAPAGLQIAELEVAEGTEVLLFREYGDFGFSVSDKDWSKEVAVGGNTVQTVKGELTKASVKGTQWLPNIYEGDSQRFLHVKPLFHDPSPADDHTKGFISLLAYAPPSWQDHKVAHHPVFEEAYCISGAMTYNFGRIDPGTYFFRPALVKHGMFHSHEPTGALWFFRLDGDLINYVTEYPEVEVHGKPINYDPNDPAQRPVLAGLPVRSRSTGAWDGQGR